MYDFVYTRLGPITIAFLQEEYTSPSQSKDSNTGIHRHRSAYHQKHSANDWGNHSASERVIYTVIQREEMGHTFLKEQMRYHMLFLELKKA